MDQAYVKSLVQAYPLSKPKIDGMETATKQQVVEGSIDFLVSEAEKTRQLLTDFPAQAARPLVGALAKDGLYTAAYFVLESLSGQYTANHLVGGLRNPNIRQRCVSLLESMDQQYSVGPLVAALGDADTNVHNCVYDLLVSYGPSLQTVRPLTASLTHAHIRKHAHSILVSYGQSALEYLAIPQGGPIRKYATRIEQEIIRNSTRSQEGRQKDRRLAQKRTRKRKRHWN